MSPKRNRDIRLAASQPRPQGKKTKQFIEDSVKEIQEKYAESTTRVVLLGKGGAGLDERRLIAQELEQEEISAIVPEDDMPPDAPDIDEEFILARDDVDLVFVNPESWGSVLEFGHFAKNPKIVGKLRILVQRKYHPVYGSGGYLTSAYFTHEVVYGHVYICGSASDSKSERVWIPSNKQIVLKIAKRYQRWKALSSK